MKSVENILSYLRGYSRDDGNSLTQRYLMEEVSQRFSQLMKFLILKILLTANVWADLGRANSFGNQQRFRVNNICNAIQRADVISRVEVLHQDGKPLQGDHMEKFMRTFALSFYRSKTILECPNRFGLIQIVLDISNSFWKVGTSRWVQIILVMGAYDVRFSGT